ncbi:hypothetical protein HUW46_08018 [Amycolatopsis sp. CA-230715]|nr:hypothetical protein HUW46_08018 [Amycolatopsis sp. CA-230715]
MKIALWIALCGLCIAAGHVLLGAVAVALLLGCLPAHRHAEPVARQRNPLGRRAKSGAAADALPRQRTPVR